MLTMSSVDKVSILWWNSRIVMARPNDLWVCVEKLFRRDESRGYEDRRNPSEVARRTGRFPQLVDPRSGVNRDVSPLFRVLHQSRRPPNHQSRGRLRRS